MRPIKPTGFTDNSQVIFQVGKKTTSASGTKQPVWPAPRWLTPPDVSNVFMSHMRTTPRISVFLTNRSSVFSAMRESEFLPVSSAVSMPSPMPHSTPGARSLVAWAFLRWSGWNLLKRRTPASRCCLPKPCWIRKFYTYYAALQWCYISISKTFYQSHMTRSLKSKNGKICSAAYFLFKSKRIRIVSILTQSCNPVKNINI